MPNKIDTEALTNRHYLGDGVYAGFDGFQVWLWTLEGDQIALEDEVIKMLILYLRHDSQLGRI